MPRFFFNVYGGKNLRDDVGEELPDYQAARVAAIALAGRLVTDEAHRIGLGEDWSMDVSDENGVLVFQFALIVVDANATAEGADKRSH